MPLVYSPVVVDFLDFLKTVEKLIKVVIKTKSTIRKRLKIKKNRKQLYYFQFRNKSFYHFLTSDLKLPAGNKCSKVTIPDKIFSSLELQKCFLAGLFDTDGGIRSHTIGFTSASDNLINTVGIALDNLNIDHSKESWVNKKYGREYYGLRIDTDSIDKFLNGLPFRNQEKLKNVLHHVDVPEWSNGLDNSLVKIKS